MTMPLASDGVAPWRAPVVRQCPRCGYDLSGVIESWKDACPMSGTCSECGLAFTWSDIHNERLVGPRWSLEHGLNWSALRLVRTCLRAAIVPGPWRSLRMELMIRASRLVWVLVASCILMHFALGIGVVVQMMLSQRIPLLPFGVFVGNVLPILAWPYGGGPTGKEDVLVVFVFAAWVGMQWAFMPLLMLILDETFRRFKVRREHLLRGVCYSSVAAVASFLLTAVVLGTTVWIPITFLAPAAAAIPTVWLWMWWCSFVKVYLRLPGAGVVVSVLMAVTLLASVTFGVVGMLILP